MNFLKCFLVQKWQWCGGSVNLNFFLSSILSDDFYVSFHHIFLQFYLGMSYSLFG